MQLRFEDRDPNPMDLHPKVGHCLGFALFKASSTVVVMGKSWSVLVVLKSSSTRGPTSAAIIGTPLLWQRTKCPTMRPRPQESM
jgi:hypothetical protein